MATPTFSYTVVFETVFTSEKSYGVSREQIEATLLPILELPRVVLPGKSALREVFGLWAAHRGLSFAGCCHLVKTKRLGLSEISPNISQYLLDAPTHWESGARAERVGGNFLAVKRGTPVDIAETVQLGGAEAWIEYQRGVFSRTESALAAMGADDFDRVVHEGIPAQVQGSFVGFMAAPNGPVYLGDVIDGFVFQHGIRHLGEIEHARSLLGLQGVS
ncbi:hypothetical protein BH23CHL4_BH23CHL4_28060 [soil metagenome]